MSVGTFHLKYDLTREDLHAWKAWCSANLVTDPRVLTLLGVVVGAFIGLGVPAILYVIVHAAGLQWDPLANFLFPVGLIAGIVFLVRALRRKRSILLKRIQTRAAGIDPNAAEDRLIGRRKLTATLDGFEVDSSVGSTSRKWSVVQNVHVTDSHVFVVADIVAVVPRNAFSSDSQRAEFVEEVESWRQQTED